MEKKYKALISGISLSVLLLTPWFIDFRSKEQQASIGARAEIQHSYKLPQNHTTFYLQTNDAAQLVLLSAKGEALQTFSEETLTLNSVKPTTLFVRGLPKKPISIRTGAAVRVVVDRAIYSKERIEIEATNIEVNERINAPDVRLTARDTLRVNEAITAEGGTVHLLSNNVVWIDEEANITTSSATDGGTILLGGDYKGEGSVPNAQKTYVHPKATLKADATEEGNGGKLIVWADDFTQVYGNLSARGAGNGKGGFIETSGKINLDVRTSPDVGAESGKGGEWLLDPWNVIIDNSTNANFGNLPAGPTFPAEGTGATITIATIVNALINGDVIITTGATGGEAGNVDIQAPIDFDGINANRTLTINAAGDISFTGGGILDGNTLSPTDLLSISLNAGGDILGAGQNFELRGGSLNINASEITIGNVTTLGGVINLTSLVGDIIVGDMNTEIAPSANNITLNSANNITTGDVDVGSNQAAGEVTYTASNNIVINGSIDASTSANGFNGNNINLIGNNIEMTGILDASGDTGAGTITIDALGTLSRAAGNLNFDASVSASSGGGGGTINITANQIASPLFLDVAETGGSAGGGGSVILDVTTGTTTINTVNLNGTNAGGDFTVVGNADLVFDTNLNSNVTGSGNGGNIDITANTITFSATFGINTSANNGGGKITLTTVGDISISGDMNSSSTAFLTTAGAITITITSGDFINTPTFIATGDIGNDITLDIAGYVSSLDVDTSGGSGASGNLAVTTGGTIATTFTGLNVSSTFGPGSITINTVGDVVFTTNVEATGTNGAPVIINSGNRITFSDGINTSGANGGGDITLTSGLHVTIPTGINTSGGINGGGNVNINADGIIGIGSIETICNIANSSSGDVSITSTNATISIDYIHTYGDATDTNGGNVTLAANGAGNNIEVRGEAAAAPFPSASIITAATDDGTPALDGNVNIVTTGAFTANLGAAPTFNGTFGPIIAANTTTNDPNPNNDEARIEGAETETMPYQSTGGRIRLGNPGPILSVTANGSWSDPNTWNCSCVPTILDDVTINAGVPVIIDALANPQANSLGVLANLDNSIGKTVEVTGAISITASTFSNDGNDVFIGTDLIVSGGGSFTDAGAGNVFIEANLNATGAAVNAANTTFHFDVGGTQSLDGVATSAFGDIVISNGTDLILGSDLICGQIIIGTAGSALDNTGSHTITATGWTQDGTFTAGTSTVILNGVGSEILGTAANFYNLNIQGNITSQTTISIGNNFSVNAGTFDNNGEILSMDGAFLVDGGGTFNDTAGGEVIVRGDLTLGTGVINASSTEFTFDGGGSQFINGAAPASLGDIAISSIGTEVTLNSNLSSSGTITIDFGAELSAGANTITTTNWIQDGTFTPGTSTVEFVGTSLIGGSALPNVLFDRLVIEGTPTTLTAPIRVQDDLVINNTLNAGANNITLLGDFIMGSGASFNHGTSTVAFRGNIEQRVNIADAGVVDFYNILLNNLAATNDRMNVDGAGSIGLLNQLTLTNGDIFRAGAPAIFFRATTLPVLGGSPNSMIDGEMVRNSTTGNYLFPIGKNGTYAPIEINQQSGANIYVEYFDTPAGDLTPDNSTVDAVSPTEYWSLSYGGSPIPATTAFINIPYDDNNRESDIIDVPNLVLAEYVTTPPPPSQWVEVPSNSTGNDVSGSVSSDAAITIPGSGLDVTFGNTVGGLNFDPNVKIWTNGTGNNSWNENDNWSPSGVPVATNDVYFNNTSSDNCNLDATVEVNSFNIASTYGGVITQNNGIAMDIATDFIIEAGIFNGATATSGDISITGDFNLTGGTFTSTAFNLSIGGVFGTGGTFNNGSGTVTYAGTGAQDVIDITYNNLSTAGSGTKTYTGTGTLTLIGDLDIGGSSTFDPNGENLEISGNFTKQATATYINNAPLVTFDGSVAQAINPSTGTIEFTNATFNNSDGFVIGAGTLLVTGITTLDNGIIDTRTNGGVLVIGTTFIGAFDATRFVDGPLTKEGTANFTFPIGDATNGVYAPVNMTFIGGPSSRITMNYNQSSVVGSAQNPPLDIISNQEYWEVSSNNAGVSADFEFNYSDTAPRLSGVSDPANLILAEDLGTTIFSPIFGGTNGVGAPDGTIRTGAYTVPTAPREITFGNLLGGTNTFGPPVSPEEYYWVGFGATPDWTDPDNWSFTSGGAGGLVGIPSVTAKVIFDDNFVNAGVSLGGDVTVRTAEFRSSSDFTLSGNSLTVTDSVLIDNPSSFNISSSASLRIEGSYFEFLGGNATFDGTVEFLGNITVTTSGIRLPVADLQILGDITFNNAILAAASSGQLTLQGNVVADATSYLLVGDGSSATFVNSGGSVDGRFGYFIDGIGSFQYPLKDYPTTLEATSVSSSGEVFINFEANNFNPIPEFTENGDPISTVFAEGAFRVESSAEMDYNVSISSGGFSTYPVGDDTRVVTSTDGGNTWFGEGSAAGSTARDGLSITSGDVKYHTLANSCTELTIAPAVFLDESVLIGCQFEDLEFTLIGAELDEGQFYRFYDANDNIIDNQFVSVEGQEDRFRPLNARLVGQEFFVTIASTNGCESSADFTPITLEIAPETTLPVLAEAATLQTCEKSSLLIPLSNTLQDGESYALIAADTTVAYTLTEDENVIVDSTVFAQATFDEEGLFAGELQLAVTTELGCTSDTVAVPFGIIQLPVVSSSQAEQTVELCEGEPLILAAGGQTFDRQTYRIEIDTDGDGEADELVTEQFTSSAGQEGETNFQRNLSPGNYTYFLSLVDEENGCESEEKITLDYIIHPNPQNPEVQEDSELIVCQGSPLAVSLLPLTGQQEYRWYTSEDRENANPFLTGNQQQLELQTLINVSEDINQGFYYVETFDATTGCVSELVPVEYTVLRLPNQPDEVEPIVICRGESIDTLLGETTLEVPNGAGFVGEAYRVVKEEEEVYRSSTPDYLFTPAEEELEGSFEVSIVRTYEIDGETFECESFPRSVAFTVNERTEIASLETGRASCNGGGTLRVQIELPTDEAGNPILRAYALGITPLAEDGTQGPTVERTRTPDAEGFIEIPDLAIGNYELQVSQVNNVNSDGEPCELEEVILFAIAPPQSPQILTEEPTLTWECSAGDFTDIAVDLGDAPFVNYQWYRGEDFSEPIGSNEPQLIGVDSGIYQLIISAGGDNLNCSADTATYIMLDLGNGCETEITAEEVDKLCALKNSLTVGAQTLLNWPDCTQATPNDPSLWTGVSVNRNGEVVELDLSGLGLEELAVEPLERFESLETLNVEENELAFDDLEQVLSIVEELLANNQAPVGEELNEVRNITQHITLSVPEGVTGVGGVVTWIFVHEGDTREEGEQIGTGVEITITNALPEEDAGTYYAEITHPDFPGVIIFRRDIGLEVTQKMIPEDREPLEVLLTKLLATLPSSESNNRIKSDFDPDAPAASWPGVIQELDRCVGLDFSSFGLSGEIPAELTQLTALRRLSFFDNNMSGTLPEGMENLTQLTYLDLDKNNLSGPVPEEIAQLSALKTLWVSRNAFTSLPENMGDLNNLAYLFAQKNQLSELPQSLGDLSNLIALNVSDNQLTSFLGTVPNLPALERLDISNNNIENLTLSLSALPKLLEFNLSDNELETLPVGLPNATQLEQLIVRRNRLDFADIEPILGLNAAYSPQKRQEGNEVIVQNVGTEVTLEVNIEGSANQYQWFKDGEIILGATQPTFTITSLSSADIGVYDCNITSTTVPDLTLLSRKFEVRTNCQGQIAAELTTESRTTFCSGESIFAVLNATEGEGFSYRWIRIDEEGNGNLLPLATGNVYNAIAAGKYTVEIEGPLGCIEPSGDTIEIILNQTPEISIALDGSILTATVAEDVDPTLIQWFVDNGKQPVGSGLSLQVDVPGLYQAKLDNGNGCVATSNPERFEITALDEELNTGEVIVYPNPAISTLNIKFPQLQKEVTMTLRNSIGKQMQVQSLERVKSASLDMEQYPRGLYLLEIQTEQGHILRKVEKR